MRRIIRRVKTLRVCVLVLMALLLPLRGVLAVGAACPGEGSATVAAQAHAGHGDSLAAASAQGGDADDSAMPCDTAEPTGVHHGSGCQASACCLMPLAASPPASVAPQPGSLARFPALVVPAAAFQSGGQDRPPRAI